MLQKLLQPHNYDVEGHTSAESQASVNKAWAVRPFLVKKPTIIGLGQPTTFFIDTDDPIAEGIVTRIG